MSKAPIRIHEDKSNGWVRIGDADNASEGHSRAYLDSTYRIHELGTDQSPQLLEARYLPGTSIGVHAHDHDEIVYVVEGEMLVGNKTSGPGSSVFVAARTLYSFSAGPAGLRFLNFRPLRDDSHISRSDFLAHRTAAGAA
ncbi:MAG: hypothetical protein NVS3B5_01280 [Sphingomicrobium sp.]